MIERKLIFVACVAGTLIASCTPYPDSLWNRRNQSPVPNGANGANGATPGTMSDLKQQEIKKQREKAKKDAERRARAERKRKAADSARSGTKADTGSAATQTPAGSGTSTPAKPDYEYATPVPGKSGFVLSPYNGKIIDVRDIPSGTLVQDPTYPASEKKYFRVP